jgi:archaellum biogenesis protein FlaJ (TadC family)
MTRVVRSDVPIRPLSVGIAMWAFAFATLFFTALFVIVGITVPSAFTGNEQTAMAAWMGMIFLIVAVMLDLYRRYYVPDEMIHKKRRPKIILQREFR